MMRCWTALPRVVQIDFSHGFFIFRLFAYFVVSLFRSFVYS